MPSWIRSRNGQPEPAVALGVGHHEPQVRLDHPVLGLLVAALDALGQLDLLAGGEQRPLRDVAQEELERVARGVGHLVDRVARLRLTAFGAVVLHLDAAPLGLGVDRLERAGLEVELLHGGRDLGQLEPAGLLAALVEGVDAVAGRDVAHLSQHTTRARRELCDQSQSSSEPAYTLSEPPRTKPHSSMPRSRARSTARVDGGPTATTPDQARQARLLHKLERRAAAHARRRRPRAGSARRAGASRSPCPSRCAGPTSSRTTSNSPEASNRPVA